MAAGRTFSAQKALNTCADHEHEELDMYCKTCKKPVCTKCVKEDHRSHDWDTLSKIAKALRKDTRRCKMEMESVSQSIFIGMEDELKNITTEEESQFEFNQSGIESSRKAVIKSVNKMFDEMKSKSDKHHTSKMKSIKEHTVQIEAKRKRLQFLIKNMETGAKDYTDADLIELHNEIKQLIKDLHRICRFPDSWYIRYNYRQGFHNKASLLAIVGSLGVEELVNNLTLETKFTCNIGDTSTNSLVPWSENEAWIHSSKTTTIKLVDNMGHIKKTVNLKCTFYNFVVSDKGIVYACDPDAKNVLQVSMAGKIRVLITTAPLLPLYINLTRSGDLLVTLVDEEINERNSSSHRVLRRISVSGETLREYEYDEDDKTPLFTLPCSPIEHADGRICVVNDYKKDDGEVSGIIYCIDSMGRIVFKYNGVDDDFLPLVICCGPQGNTLVSDSSNKTIHILDSNGKFVHFLLTEEDLREKPYAIAFTGERLWVGSRSSGLIQVFKYRD